MKVKVMGKAHLEGVSKKTGKPFNLNQVHFMAKARGVEGLSSERQFLDSKAYPYDQIVVGLEYNLERDGGGFVVEFEPVDRAAWEKAISANKF